MSLGTWATARPQLAKTDTDDPRASKVASGIELPGIYPDSSERGHSQPALKKDHVAKRDESGAMFGGDRGRGAIYSRITDREQGNELFMGELFRFCGHAPKHGPLRQSCMFSFAQTGK